MKTIKTNIVYFEKHDSYIYIYSSVDVPIEIDSFLQACRQEETSQLDAIATFRQNHFGPWILERCWICLFAYVAGA